MIINRLCMIFVAILFPDRTAMKSPAIDILITARTKATIAGMVGFESHMVPMKKRCQDRQRSDDEEYAGGLEGFFRLKGFSGASDGFDQTE